MRIAITDACIFIDLLELGLINPFFELSLEVHTSLDVINELNATQIAILKAYQSTGKLTVHNISNTERQQILNSKYPKTLSASDQTVLFLAEKHQAILLSSDKPVRHNANVKAIEYHGMLWIFDQLVEQGMITPVDASEKIKILFTTNIIYQNNRTLIAEMITRVKSWEKKK